MTRKRLPVSMILVCIMGMVLSFCGHFSQARQGNGPNQPLLPEKLASFAFMEGCKGTADPLLATIEGELKEKGTVVDLMKFYADELQKDMSTTSPYFQKLQKIFACGLTPERMEGYYHGAVVAFRNETYLNIFDLNTLNMTWPLARLFSPWRGKTFEPISEAKLMEITDGWEAGKAQIAWGSNTYSTRGFREKMIVSAMKGLKIKVEAASVQEVSARDYDVKSFFFIGKPARSVNADNAGRMVYQFNYRWPRLETFPPDNYCIDEIVMIADGLYLGQLVYATALKKRFDPNADPGTYGYTNFGYFLLMDDEWHARRIKIGYDIHGSGQ